MSYGSGRGYGGGQTREQRFERSRQTDAAPYVHPSRQQTMPANVDLSAPVIHFGTSREVAPRQSMKDQHFARAQDEKNQTFLTPATKEQKLLTLFIGGIGEDLDDYWMDRILKSAAKLRLWKRATDGTGKQCQFGFAEYEDPESVNRAYQLLQDFRLPDSASGHDRQFIISQDETSKLYVEDYLAAKESKINETKERNILSSASGQLEKVMKDFINPEFKRHDEQDNKAAKAMKKINTTTDESEAVTIMLSIEDELGDIPEEQRESIAKEITSFRERSAKRDQERARQIADAESRRLEFERASRQEQRSKDPEKDGSTEIAMIRRTKKERVPYEEENMTEEEIARRREEQRIRDAQIRYLEEERRWHSREASRIAAYERDNIRREEQMARQLADKAQIAEKLSTFDDDMESSRGTEDFYKDRSAWIRTRSIIKAREADFDKQDRLDEEREDELMAAKSRNPKGVAAPIAASESTKGNRSVDAEMAAGPVRLSLAKKAEDVRKPVVNAEAILADEEDGSAKKRVLIPLHYADNDTSPVIDQEAEQARLRSILDGIPSRREDLWKYAVSWEKLNDTILAKVQEFVGKKIVEAIGMEEEDLIAFVMNKIRTRGHPQEIVQELSSAIGDEEESELLTVKIWRYLLMVTETA